MLSLISSIYHRLELWQKQFLIVNLRIIVQIKLDSCTGLGRAGGHRVHDSIDSGEVEHQRYLHAVRARMHIIDTTESCILNYVTLQAE